MQASKHRIPLKTAKNDAFSPKQSGLKTTSGEFLGMYELDFSCSLIFHQLWTHIGYFKGKKDQLIFSPISAIFYRQADFQTLQQPPKSDSWGFHGGIPSSGTQGSPPNHFWKKNISGLKSLTPYPSPLCSVGSGLRKVLEKARKYIMALTPTSFLL